MLRVAGSLAGGNTNAIELVRALQGGGRPTTLGRAIAEYGRVPKTLHLLQVLNDENYRRQMLVQLNRQEGRHSLARAVFHGQKGELRKPYREGQEDQLGALGLVVNAIVLWNTRYIALALEQLRTEGSDVRDEDVERLSPLAHWYINLQGRYYFGVPEEVQRGELRPLRHPEDEFIELADARRFMLGGDLHREFAPRRVLHAGIGCIHPRPDGESVARDAPVLIQVRPLRPVHDEGHGGTPPALADGGVWGSQVGRARPAFEHHVVRLHRSVLRCFEKSFPFPDPT